MATTEQDTIFTLYRFYDADDALLYVGLTRNPAKRFEKHAGDKSWWAEVARIQLEQHDSLAALREAERLAIQSEGPQYNIRMNGSSARPKIDAAEDPEIDGLVGRFFHTFRDLEDDDRNAPVVLGRAVVYQGRVLEEVTEDLYAVETFSWWDGCPSGGHTLTRIDEMLDWRFYDSGLAMQAALGCRDSRGRREVCGGECSHLAWCIGTTTVCHSCAEAYSYAVEIVWRDGRPDEKATLAALNKLVPEMWK